MKTKTMTQCVFRKGTTIQVAWIDTRGAEVGNEVELGKGTGDFWEVIGRGLTMDANKVKEKENKNIRVFASI